MLRRKRIFLIGVACFGVASLAAGLSATGGELIAARVVQGTAAAAMAPQVLATFRAIFAARERGKAFGSTGRCSASRPRSALLIGAGAMVLRFFTAWT